MDRYNKTIIFPVCMRECAKYELYEKQCYGAIFNRPPCIHDGFECNNNTNLQNLLKSIYSLLLSAIITQSSLSRVTLLAHAY